jgi:hypothetical protein
MQVNIGRMKKWDWGVVIAFVVTIVGVSIPWWKAKIGDVLGDLYEGLGGLAGVPDVPSTNALGWDLDGGVAAFVFALFVTIWVFAKILLPAGKPLPKWYMEAWPVLVIGGILTLIGIIGTADAPAGGYDFWAWRPGGIITLAAGLGVAYCGWMMLKDKSGDYGMSPDLDINKLKSAVQSGSTTQAPPQAGSKFCVGCGSPLDPGATECKNCGRPV